MQSNSHTWFTSRGNYPTQAQFDTRIVTINYNKQNDIHLDNLFVKDWSPTFELKWTITKIATRFGDWNKQKFWCNSRLLTHTRWDCKERRGETLANVTTAPNGLKFLLRHRRAPRVSPSIFNRIYWCGFLYSAGVTVTLSYKEIDGGIKRKKVINNDGTNNEVCESCDLEFHSSVIFHSEF